MSWSYGNDPANSDLDAVRFLTGDTDTTDQQLSDEEINYLLVQFENVYSAAAVACRSIAAKYARFTSKYLGDLRIEYGQRMDHYLALAETLETQSSLAGASPYLGGDSVSEKQVNYDDLGKTQPYFTRDQFGADDAQNELNLG